MAIVVDRYHGPVTLHWDAGETPAQADLIVEEELLHGGGAGGSIGWRGNLVVANGQAVWDAWNSQNREQLRISIGERVAEIVATRFEGTDLRVTGSGAPPFGDIV